MTYCVGIKLDAGIVFLSDSRTNAGVDQVRTFRKTHRFERAGERIIVVLTAGNLALSQAVLSTLRASFQPEAIGATLWNAKTMFDVAAIVGDAVRNAHHRDSGAMQRFGLEFNLSLIVGGQIRGEATRLFNVYNVGNFIESTQETPYFQLGEAKYG
ncbi:MAG TPA: peptidase, partial [Gammaproteobacteria bacterium]|nr:peptidase [Gammaproteobacteria bacterium]